MNYLICSVGKHAKLIQSIRKTIQEIDITAKVIVTANQELLPALYCADKYYITPDIKDETYIDELIKICKKENIHAITTMLDLETLILSEHREKFSSLGINVMVPEARSAKVCYDKYLMYEYLQKNKVETIKSYKNLQQFDDDYISNNINFPVFVKPNSGRGSVGAKKINTYSELKFIYEHEDDLLIQEFIDGVEIDIDVYVDTINNEPVSIFSKKKLKAGIGGTTQSISFKDQKLFDFVDNIVSKFKFYGPINIEVFFKNNQYILSEINPRFSAAYLHAFESGVNFIKLMDNNLNEVINESVIGEYVEDSIMMLYNEPFVINKSEIYHE